MSKKGKIIIISGPSGVGKGTITKKILEDKNLNVNISISCTTRKKRDHEIDGKDYFFIDKEKFAEMIQNNELLEYADVFSNYYGTPKKYCYDQIKQGKNIILEIETDGASKIKEKINKEDIISIFLIPPSIHELKVRLMNRNTESEEQIQQRIKKAELELLLIESYDHIILNYDADHAAQEIKDIIRNI